MSSQLVSDIIIHFLLIYRVFQDGVALCFAECQAIWDVDLYILFSSRSSLIVDQRRVLPNPAMRCGILGAQYTMSVQHMYSNVLIWR